MSAQIRPSKKSEETLLGCGGGMGAREEVEGVEGR